VGIATVPPSGMYYGVPPTAAPLGGGLTSLHYVPTTGVMGLASIGLSSGPMMVTVGGPMLSTSVGTSGGFSFVDSQPNATSSASDPFSFVQMQ